MVYNPFGNILTSPLVVWACSGTHSREHFFPTELEITVIVCHTFQFPTHREAGQSSMLGGRESSDGHTYCCQGNISKPGWVGGERGGTPHTGGNPAKNCRREVSAHQVVSGTVLSSLCCMCLQKRVTQSSHTYTYSSSSSFNSCPTSSSRKCSLWEYKFDNLSRLSLLSVCRSQECIHKQ